MVDVTVITAQKRGEDSRFLQPGSLFGSRATPKSAFLCHQLFKGKICSEIYARSKSWGQTLLFDSRFLLAVLHTAFYESLNLSRWCPKRIKSAIARAWTSHDCPFDNCWPTQSCKQNITSIEILTSQNLPKVPWKVPESDQRDNSTRKPPCLLRACLVSQSA